ncbi:Pre-mRNA-processing factor 31 [Diplonema papillatum]|nr:Pre-mRNA-processing factor 31 [Diplonema papillatum]WGM49972.1 PRP31B [Diplonema papillatum]|eukprot:gene20560-31666_t
MALTISGRGEAAKRGPLMAFGDASKKVVENFDAEDFDELLNTVEDGLERAGPINDLVDEDIELDDYDRFKSVKEVAEILRSVEFQKMLADIEKYTSPTAPMKNTITRDDPEHALLHTAMKSCVQIQTEIGKVHKFLRGKYKKYFPELEQFIVEPVQYAKVVKVVGNSTELVPMVEKLKAAGLTSTMIVRVIVTRSTCKPADETGLTEQRYLIEACDELLSLETAKQFVLEYTQLRMNVLSPNVSAIIGPAIAAQVVGIVSGLDNLMKLSSDEVMLLGRTRKHREQEMADGSLFHGSFLLNCDIVQAQEPDFRDRSLRMVANKVILAARIDGNRYASDGTKGAIFREKIVRQIEGIMDGSLVSSYRPGGYYQRGKRNRDAQDSAVLAAAREQLAQSGKFQKIAPRKGGYKGSKGGKGKNDRGGPPHSMPQPTTSSARML